MIESTDKISGDDIRKAIKLLRGAKPIAMADTPVIFGWAYCEKHQYVHAIYTDYRNDKGCFPLLSMAMRNIQRKKKKS